MMTAVLIIHERAELASALRDAFRLAGQATSWCGSLEEAIEHLAQRAADLVLCDVSPRAATFPAAVRRAAPRAALLGVLDEGSASPDPRAVAALTDGVVLRPPFVPARIAEAARAAQSPRRGFVGNLSGVPLIEVVQMFNVARRTATVVLEGETPGRVDFDRGEVVHAECGDARGREAFARLLNAPGGRFRALPYAAVERTIVAPFDTLLMEALRANDGPDAGDAFEGLDGLRSWVPDALPCDELPCPAIPPPASLPDVACVACEPPIATRWRAARGSLSAHGDPQMVLSVRGATAAMHVLEGNADPELREAVLALVQAVTRTTTAGCSGVLEYQAGGVALAVLWNRVEGDTLVLARDGRTGASAFRAYAAAAAQRVLEPCAARQESA